MVKKKWGKFVHSLMVRARHGGRTEGYQRALEAEIEAPQTTDPEWCRMIVALAAGRDATFPDDPADPETFRCWLCRDTGFTLADRPSPLRYSAVYSRPCSCLSDRVAQSDADTKRRPSWW